MTIRLTKLSNAEYALRDIREATIGDGTLKGASPRLLHRARQPARALDRIRMPPRGRTRGRGGDQR